MKRSTALALFLLLSSPATASEDFPDEWLTVAEKTDFRATSSYDQTMVYLYRLEAAASDKIRVTDFGRSGQGRPLPLVIVSADGTFTPEASEATGKPIVLGGLLSNKETSKNNMIPGLGQIPVLGNAFKTHDNRYDDSEFVIYIIPFIQKSEELIKQANEAGGYDNITTVVIDYKKGP